MTAAAATGRSSLLEPLPSNCRPRWTALPISRARSSGRRRCAVARRLHDRGRGKPSPQGARLDIPRELCRAGRQPAAGRSYYGDEAVDEVCGNGGAVAAWLWPACRLCAVDRGLAVALDVRGNALEHAGRSGVRWAVRRHKAAQRNLVQAVRGRNGAWLAGSRCGSLRDELHVERAR